MRGGTKVIIIGAILFFIAIMYGNLTGAAYRSSSSGELLGARLVNHVEREVTSVEILGAEINGDGLPVVKRGRRMDFIVKPGVNGVHTGYQVEKAQSGLRFEGDHCGRGGSGDFCSNTYKCVDEDPKKCNIKGSKCYGDKLVDIRVPENQNPGVYVVNVCDASDECCYHEIKEPFIII